MSINTEQFTAANKATVDSLLSVANTALASAERIAALNLNTARADQGVVHKEQAFPHGHAEMI